MPQGPRDLLTLAIIGLMLGICLKSTAQPTYPVQEPSVDSLDVTPSGDFTQAPSFETAPEIPTPFGGLSLGDPRQAEEIIIPNLFTPNGDGYNDTWIISGLRNRGKYDIQIYSRQGSLLYESTDYANDWDGRYNGVPLPNGTYYYVFRIKKAGFLQRGMLNILRP